MSSETTTLRSTCLNCGYEAPSGGDEWRRIEVRGIGRLSQCPECESTNVLSGR